MLALHIHAVRSTACRGFLPCGLIACRLQPSCRARVSAATFGRLFDLDGFKIANECRNSSSDLPLRIGCALVHLQHFPAKILSPHRHIATPMRGDLCPPIDYLPRKLCRKRSTVSLCVGRQVRRCFGQSLPHRPVALSRYTMAGRAFRHVFVFAEVFQGLLCECSPRNSEAPRYHYRLPVRDHDVPPPMKDRPNRTSCRQQFRRKSLDAPCSQLDFGRAALQSFDENPT